MALNGTFTIQEIRQSIQNKKDQYKDYKHMDPPSRIVTNGPVYWLSNSDENSFQSQRSVRSLILKGNGASGGVVEGKVKVMTDYADVNDLNGEILVITKTDSNLMQYFPSITGLLVEGGTQLSNSVIVAREFGLPVITEINNLTNILKTGMHIRIDGTKGTIEVLNLPQKDITDFKKAKNGKLLIY
jgi:pyruvate,water dikinase